MLTGKPTGKRPLGRPRRRWEENIRMELEEIGSNEGNWVDSAQDRNLECPCECGIEPPGSISHGVSVCSEHNCYVFVFAVRDRNALKPGHSHITCRKLM